MQDLYFKNEEVRIIFGLAELGGQQQLDFLGIDFEHYSNKELAKSSKLNEALEKLKILYRGMIGK